MLEINHDYAVIEFTGFLGGIVFCPNTIFYGDISLSFTCKINHANTQHICSNAANLCQHAI